MVLEIWLYPHVARITRVPFIHRAKKLSDAHGSFMNFMNFDVLFQLTICTYRTYTRLNICKNARYYYEKDFDMK